MINKLVIIGCGLIGGSVARALRKAGKVGHVMGVGRDQGHLERAKQLGVIDGYTTQIEDIAVDAEVIVVAVPVGAVDDIFQKLSGTVGDNTVITDVGSTKLSVIASAQQHLGKAMVQFVPGHPIAGTEKSGVDASVDNLYVGKRVILTPAVGTQTWALERVRAMWQWVGADVVEISAKHHDEVLAATSHLPHLLAYTLVDSLASMDDKDEIFDYAAGGFRDFTRIASSDPQMWHDICAHNQAAIMKTLTIFMGDLQALLDAISDRDSDYVHDMFRRAKKVRDQLCD